MTMKTEYYTSAELQKLNSDYGDRYAIEFEKVYTKYFGDIFPTTKIKSKDGKIHQVSFYQPINPNASKGKSLSGVSNDLKEKLESTKDKLKSKQSRSYQEALLIMEAFDERWFDEFNLINTDDGVRLKCWGVQYYKIPPPQEKSIEELIPSEEMPVPEEIKEMEKNSKSLEVNKYLIWIVVIFCFLALILSINKDSSNTEKKGWLPYPHTN